MSALPTGDDVVFRLRMAKDELKKDLAGAEADVKAAAARQRTAMEKVFGPAIKPRFDLQEQEVRKQMADMIRKMRDTAKQAKIQVEVQTRMFGPAVAEAKELEGRIKDTANATESATDKAVRIGKALAVARLAAEGLQLAADGIDLGKAFSSGNLEKIEKATAALKQTILNIPVAGAAGQSLGRIADASSDSIVAWARRKVAGAFGKQTDQEMAEFDEAQAKIEAKLARTERLIQDGKAQAAAADAIVQRLQRGAARQGKSAGEIAVMDAEDALKDFNAELAKRPSTSAVTDSDKAAQAALTSAIAAAKSAKATDEVTASVEKLKAAGSGLENFWDKFKRGAVDALEAQAKKDKEINKLRIQHEQQTDDLIFSAREKMLQRTGQAELAAREAIERQAREAIEEGADIDAVIANAKEELMGLQNVKKGPSFDIVQRADLLNFGGAGGAFNPKTELSKGEQSIIDRLKEIRDKGPQVAVTAP